MATATAAAPSRRWRRRLLPPGDADSGASLPDGTSPFDITALLKCYLVNIPRRITTFALYDELRDARVSIPGLRNILKKLPNVNYMTLELITSLLLRVSRKSSFSKIWDECVGESFLQIQLLAAPRTFISSLGYQSLS